MIHRRTVRSTLIPMEMDHGDKLRLTLSDGSVRTIRLISTRAIVDSSSRPYLYSETSTPPDQLESVRLQTRYDARIVLRMHCTIEIDGTAVELVRWVGNQRCFYEPWVFAGIRVWFDGASALFDYLSETHGPCRPRRHARFAFQEASLRICPPRLNPWCPLPPDTLRIEECYSGSDCWMGPYAGSEMHGGLDINHPAGTAIWAPLNLDSQGLAESVAAGDRNNVWQGQRTWGDESRWTLQVHHVISPTLPDGEPAETGEMVALGAGMAVGAYEHSHFGFSVTEPGAAEDESILLDPWILFWQMYRDREEATT